MPKWIKSGCALSGHAYQLTAPDSSKPVSQFYTKCTTILDNGGSLNFLSHRFGVTLVEQVIEASRNSQFSQKIFGIERGIGHECATHYGVKHREPATDFLSLETGEKLLGK